MDKPIKLQSLVTEIQVTNLDETLVKLEKLKSLICEINDLTNGKLFKIVETEEGELRGVEKRIYEELVLIRKELQAIRSSQESDCEIIVGRAPYGRSYHVLPKRYYKGQQQLTACCVQLHCGYGF